MSLVHLFNLDSLASEFQTITNIINEITDKKILLNDNLQKLKNIYNSLIKNNNKKIFLFCLDSFYFQYKILNMEMENISKFIILVCNRMYGDYYKLYNIILVQINEKGFDIPEIATITKKHSVYKDLEPYAEYDITNISEIHGDILEVLDLVYRFYMTKEEKMHTYQESTKIGISIMNFIHTLEYDNVILREQIMLYFNYISFFHQIQKNYLNKILSKINSFQREIDEDIMQNQKQLPTHTQFIIENVLEECIVKPNYNPLKSLINDTDNMIQISDTLLTKIETLASTPNMSSEEQTLAQSTQGIEVNENINITDNTTA